ncbi:NKG2-C type II integral membrane protein-like [Nycticebus coucang]|uniref:NKG2-C type II integral membrane protein-like n=1 Tax=Nycticebus coucang TaxID=9470 RepID=UPI00234D2375|nr:NKG2-C type II integral membrane protein-like [Nycticebus coucang]
MKDQTVTFSRLNLAKDPKRHQRKPKGGKSYLSETEQEITPEELNLQNATLNLQGEDKPGSHTCCLLRKPSKQLSPPSLLSVSVSLPAVLPLPPDKHQFTAEILGVICIVLLASVLKMIAFIIITQTQNNSLPNVTTQKGYPCGHCPEEWFTYSSNCYYIGKELKTWNESSMACASKNSTLLYVDDEEERKFLSILLWHSWTGVFRQSSGHPWVSINGSAFKLNITEIEPGKRNCAALTSGKLQSDECGSSKIYICKHKL